MYRKKCQNRTFEYPVKLFERRNLRDIFIIFLRQVYQAPSIAIILILAYMQFIFVSLRGIYCNKDFCAQKILKANQT